MKIILSHYESYYYILPAPPKSGSIKFQHELILLAGELEESQIRYDRYSSSILYREGQKAFKQNGPIRMISLISNNRPLRESDNK